MLAEASSFTCLLYNVHFSRCCFYKGVTRSKLPPVFDDSQRGPMVDFALGGGININLALQEI